MLTGIRRFARPTVLARAPTALLSTERPEPQTVQDMLQIGTRRIFEHEHDMYRETCRTFYKEKVAPFNDEWEQQGKVSREVWLQAGEQGMLGVTVPEEYGGMGLDCLYAAVNWEEQAYSLQTGPGWSLHRYVQHCLLYPPLNCIHSDYISNSQ